MSTKVKQIHQASMRILAETGMQFHHPDAQKLLKENGIRMEGNVAYFTEDQVMHWVKKAPTYANLYAENPIYDMEIGGTNSYVGPSGGATHIMDKDGNTRDALMADFIKMMKLYEGNPAYHINGGLACQPNDIPAETSTILLAFTSLFHTEKCIFTAAGDYGTMEALIKLACTRFSATPEELRAKPRICTIASTNSPLQLDINMTESILTMVKYGQPVVIAAAAMAGTTGPVTLAGTLTVVNAEVIAAIVLSQMAAPGAPVIYGSQSSAADMASGAMAIGSPEGALCYKYCAEMAKFYCLPSRGGGALCDAKSLNAQAGYESMLTCLAAKQSGINIMYQSAGIMDGYLSVSYEKMVTDFEIIDYVDCYLKDIDINDETIPEALIHDVGQSGQYLTQMHTMRHCRSDIYAPKLSVRGPQKNGTAKFEANIARRIEDLINTYKKPDIAPEIVDALTAVAIEAGVQPEYIQMVLDS